MAGEEKTGQPQEKDPVEETKANLEEHFEALEKLLRYAKEKDRNLLVLSKRLDEMREENKGMALKPIALEIIAYREENRKSLNELPSLDLPEDKWRKYLEYLALDLEDRLQDLGIEEKDGVLLLNGRKVLAQEKCEPIVLPESKTLPEGTFQPEDGEDLLTFVSRGLNELQRIIEDNTELDNILHLALERLGAYEQEGKHLFAFAPVARGLLRLHGKLQEWPVGEDAKESYRQALEESIKESETLLSLCGVDIDSFVSEIYDPRRQRILHFLECEKEEDNGKVIKRLSDCYTLQDKVIYPMKVDVYRHSEKKAN